MNKTWNLSPHVEKMTRETASRFSTKHGMLAAVPLICKGADCPYIKSCTIDENELPKGYRCPIEIGAIVSRFDHWCKHFNISIKDDIIDDKDLVDATLIRDLIDNEIQILRAENRIAISADFIAKTVNMIDDRGKVYYKDEVSPEASFKVTLLDKKYKILQLLNSTRKDKARNEKMDLNPSQQAMSLFNKIKERINDKGEK